jgi:predicted nucleic acid-binding protein
MFVFDTNAIIYYLKDDPQAVPILENIFEQSSPVYISTVTEAELFGFSSLTEKEIERIDSLLSSLSIIPLDSRLARMAGYIRRNHRLKIPDSVIAATTLFTNSVLVTRNTHDFSRIRELKTLRV